ncbi:MAG TPA: GNAT family N-acetyltransferase [Oxalicibacterium sp.]|uniref:GNAT family N-acetyltransferase n=1 Tax=Oxalicibacterium sp. TaxID=2766525 RepID=UPI002BEA4437|nr:GNAT family N-acetyltransferase [Oxalicibacterium sp.]HWU97395.1 GNAT family N-acetyltransferase [Oxalicibacterium sp.]
MNKTEPTASASAVLHYRTRIVSSLSEIGQPAWDGLLALQADANPFLSFAFLDALHESGSASVRSGWQPQFVVIWRTDRNGNDELAAALPLYAKNHSYGEYVFDWAWADAYERNGLDYYPKLLSAIPFTPVTGSRLIARDAEAQSALVAALGAIQQGNDFSSTHILYPPQEQAEILHDDGFLLRTGVQFHWLNNGYRSFDEFLETLERKKRKNIRAERRKVQEAGVSFRHIAGRNAKESDWQFFKRCYDHTYAAHHSTPYLNLDFFLRIGATMPDNLLLIVAERDGLPIASSLVVHDGQTLYGRYWGALAHVDCLHFETAYYQPLEFCISNRIACFEGGAQGEHKMARGFLPQKTWSAHWLAHPAFANAIEEFLQRESGDIDSYIDELNERNPFKA